MEYALGAKNILRKWLQMFVLILVVMEYALGVIQQEDGTYEKGKS